jgi:hypothetical protein
MGEIANQVAVTALTSAGISGIAWLLVRTWIEGRIRHEYDRRLAKHKSNLDRANAETIERLRTGLALESFHKQTAMGHLLTRRAEALVELYDHMAQLQNELEGYTATLELSGAPSKPERREALMAIARRFDPLLRRNTIYLPSCTELMVRGYVKAFKSIYFDAHRCIENPRGTPNTSDPERWFKLETQCREELRAALDGIKDEFRKLLEGDQPHA